MALVLQTTSHRDQRLFWESSASFPSQKPTPKPRSAEREHRLDIRSVCLVCRQGLRLQCVCELTVGRPSPRTLSAENLSLWGWRTMYQHSLLHPLRHDSTSSRSGFESASDWFELTFRWCQNCQAALASVAVLFMLLFLVQIMTEK